VLECGYGASEFAVIEFGRVAYLSDKYSAVHQNNKNIIIIIIVVIFISCNIPCRYALWDSQRFSQANRSLSQHFFERVHLFLAWDVSNKYPRCLFDTTLVLIVYIHFHPAWKTQARLRDGHAEPSGIRVCARWIQSRMSRACRHRCRSRRCNSPYRRFQNSSGLIYIYIYIYDMI